MIGLISILALGMGTLGAFRVVNAATAGSCIITLFGQQYDVTSLQAGHTGGSIFVCGTDMTATYQAMHGTDVSRMAPFLIVVPTPTPTPTVVPTATPVPTQSPSPSQTPVPTSTPTPTPSSTPSPTVTPSPTSTPGSIITDDDDEEEDEDSDDEEDEDEEEEDSDDHESRGHHNLSQIVEKWEQHISRRFSSSSD